MKTSFFAKRTACDTDSHHVSVGARSLSALPFEMDKISPSVVIWCGETGDYSSVISKVWHHERMKIGNRLQNRHTDDLRGGQLFCIHELAIIGNIFYSIIEAVRVAILLVSSKSFSW